MQDINEENEYLKENLRNANRLKSLTEIRYKELLESTDHPFKMKLKRRNNQKAMRRVIDMGN